jgi:hypothetical protein
VAVRRAHPGNLDALIRKPSDMSVPFSFDQRPPFELETDLTKKINRPSEVIDDDSYIVHPFESHVFAHLVDRTISTMRALKMLSGNSRLIENPVWFDKAWMSCLMAPAFSWG